MNIVQHAVDISTNYTVLIQSLYYRRDLFENHRDLEMTIAKNSKAVYTSK